MSFKETLPEQCPPSDASDSELNGVVRFLPFKPANNPKNYDSYAELGRDSRNASKCDARSLSLWDITSAKKVVAAKKMAFLKKLELSLLNIPQGSGMNIIKSSGHIDFWMYSNFDPTSNVTSVLKNVDELKQVWTNA